MAKKSQINRDNKRKALIGKYAEQRATLAFSSSEAVLQSETSTTPQWPRCTLSGSSPASPKHHFVECHPALASASRPSSH